MCICLVFFEKAVVYLLYKLIHTPMIPGLYHLIVLLVVAALVYYLGSLVPTPIVQKLASVIAIIIAIVALLSFLQNFIS